MPEESRNSDVLRHIFKASLLIKRRRLATTVGTRLALVRSHCPESKTGIRECWLLGDRERERSWHSPQRRSERRVAGPWFRLAARRTEKTNAEK